MSKKEQIDGIWYKIKKTGGCAKCAFYVKSGYPCKRMPCPLIHGPGLPHPGSCYKECKLDKKSNELDLIRILVALGTLERNELTINGKTVFTLRKEEPEESVIRREWKFRDIQVREVERRDREDKMDVTFTDGSATTIPIQAFHAIFEHWRA